MTNLRAAIYARVSSAGQRDKQTVESQLLVLRPFVAAQGWELAGEYVDDGRSAKTGALERRDAFARLMRDAEQHRFDIVVVFDINRLTRTGSIEERAQILGPFQRLGIQIATPSGGVLDLRSFFGEFYTLLQALVAAEDNRKRAEGIKAGKLRAIARGRKPAGASPYGLRYDVRTGAWSIDDGEAAIVREVYERSLAGETARAIAADLQRRGVPRPQGGRWTDSTVYVMLRHTAYRGELVVDRGRGLKIDVPAIVSPATWFACRDRASTSGLRGLRRCKQNYLLEGSLAVCALCGSRIAIQSASHTGNPRRRPTPAKYVCSKRRRPELGETPCAARYWDVGEVDDRIWSAISRLVNTPGRLERAAAKLQARANGDGDTWKADLEAAERRVAQLARAEAAIMSRFQAGTISAEALDLFLAKSKRDMEMAKQQVEAARRAQFAAGRASSRATNLAKLIETLRARSTNPSAEEKRELVRQILRPRSVVLSIATIELEALLDEAISGGQAGGSHLCADGLSTLRIRLVA